MLFLYNPTFLLFVVLPGMLLSLWAVAITKSTFARYSRIASSRGYSGAEAARAMLAAEGVHDVGIEPTRGLLTDHYDPRSRTLRLSEQVYGSNSLAAVGIACHEAGHALQHAQRYPALAMRSTLVPLTSLGSSFYWIPLTLGMLMKSPPLAGIGLLLLVAVVVFALVTLPVEWNASARAKRAMISAGIVRSHEQGDAGRVLNAAFLTYVASAVTALLTLVYWLWRLGLLGGRSND